MAKGKKGGFPWLGVGLGVGALAVLGLAGKAKAEASALEPYEDPALSRVQAAQAMSDKLHALLDAKGFDTFAVYETPTSSTEGIKDRAGVRNLVAENQAGYETFYGFMWSTNGILKFQNYDYANDGKWADYIEQYNKALAYISGL